MKRITAFQARLFLLRINKNERGRGMTTTKANQIVLPFTPEHLKILLHEVCDDQNEFTHQQLVYWCEKYALYSQEYMLDEKKWQQGLMDESEKEEAKAFAIAEDITRQWYAYMMKQCSSEEFNVDSVPYLEMPKGLFVKWLNDLYIS